MTPTAVVPSAAGMGIYSDQSVSGGNARSTNQNRSQKVSEDQLLAKGLGI